MGDPAAQTAGLSAGDEHNNIHHDNLSFMQTLLAGSAAGVFADSITHPMDTVRARLQVQRVGESVYRGTIHAVTTILRREGLRSLWKGCGVVLGCTAPAHALYFSAYDSTKYHVLPQLGIATTSTLGHFFCGFAADLGGSMVWIPMEVVKQRQQVHGAGGGAVYKSTVDAFRTIWRTQGIAGLYQGGLASVATYGPFVGIYFMMYEEGKRRLRERSQSKTLPFWQTLAMSAVGGAVATVVTTPLDVVKTRLQVAQKGDAHAYKGWVDAVRQIARKEGVRGFASGLAPRLLWIPPNTALTMAGYEQMKAWLRLWDGTE